MGRKYKLSTLSLVLLIAFIFNFQFLDGHVYNQDTLLTTADIASILEGYRQTPNLLTDGLKWWHGEWIQVGLPNYRPLASYLLWIESHIVLRYGFMWVAWIGFVFFVANCLLTAVLAWRLTRSKACVFLAAVLAAMVRFLNPGQRPEWLAWFPCHQDLLMNAFMLGALCSLWHWFATGHRRFLFATWGLYLAGCLTKEFVYVFPLFALVVVASGGLRRWARVSLRSGMIQVGLMLASVLVLWLYRSAVIEQPRNPTLLPGQLIHKPVAFLFPVFTRYLLELQFISPRVWKEHYLTSESWMLGLAVILFASIGGSIRLRRAKPHAFWTRLYVLIPMLLGMILLFLGVAGPTSDMPGTTNTFGARILLGLMILIDRPTDSKGLIDLVKMLTTLYSLYLLWHYRKTALSLEAFSFLYIIHLPVLDYIGWHYTLPAGFIWSAYYALVTMLVWRNLPMRRNMGCLSDA